VRAGGKHNDLEQVGRTTRHHTFFEMLGNFSFGDYFKKEAIAWAWELVTSPNWFGIPKDKLYVTIFEGATIPHADIPRDTEAYDSWRSLDVPADRIFALDMKDNFWQMGDTGPCGPCSEIHYDLGPKVSDLGHTDCAFPCDCGRYVELWNLVFMQFNRDLPAQAGEQGNMTPLPRPSIDTGAGLERFCTVLQGKVSNFDTDLFRPLIKEAADLANVEYGATHDTDVSLRIIADHARAATFLISDGVLPSNEGRGYVLRLILRRALYHGQTLGLNEPFMFKLAGEVVAMMKDAYPELVETEHHIAKAIKIEEDRYAQTVRVALERLEDALIAHKDGTLKPFRDFKKLRTAFGPAVVGPGMLIGGEVFKLHDTFGLRPEFVEDVLKNYGVSLDMQSYLAEMDKQRARARASWKATAKRVTLPVYQDLVERIQTPFEGYYEPKWITSRVVALIVAGRTVEEVSPGRQPKEVEIVLERTPFYAEAGGQVSDTGRLMDIGTFEEVARITDTFTPVTGLIVHKAMVHERLRVGDFVQGVVDPERRNAIRRNHTATHLLHAALRKTLGTHVKQAGSLVAPDRLRFDFTHYAALDPQDLLDIEDLVNERILANEVVETQELELDAAVNSGAVALFGEKYADKVRVLSINDFSRELCGGTHVSRTGDIGLFKIVSESSVAAGTRRIEAVTGAGVLKHLREASATLALLAEALRAKPDDLLQAVEKLTESERKLRKQLESQQRKQAAAQAGDLVENAVEVKGVPVIAARVEAADRAAMRQMVDNLRPRLGSGVIVLGSVADEKVSLVAAVSKDLTDRLDAGKIAKAAAVIVEGTGGGRKDLAEAGGKNPAKLEEALQAVPSIIEKML
jgi:alanyl-tRNA synthetase